MKKRSAFSLIELLITAAIGVLFAGLAGMMLVSVTQWYWDSEAKAQYFDQGRRLDMQFRSNLAGVGFYEVFDWFPQSNSKTTAGTTTPVFTVNTPSDVLTPNITIVPPGSINSAGNMLVLAYSNWNTPSSLNGVTNPVIERISGYVVDATSAKTPVLRFFDSGDPNQRPANMPPSPYKTWVSQFPYTWNNSGGGNLQTQGILPPQSLLPTFKIVCQLDPLFVNGSIAAWLSPTGTNKTGQILNNQTFYPQSGTILANLCMRCGSQTDWYSFPLTLTFTPHQ